MNLKRFTVREEYFGSIIYDSEKKDYIPFDEEATLIFKKTSEGQTLADIYSQYLSNKSEQSFKTFVNLCKSIGLLNENDVFDGNFINKQVLDENKKCLSAPLKVHLQVTNECPLKCRHCSQLSREPRENELTFEEISHLISELSEIGVKEICFSGGDPFCRDDFVNIVNIAVRKGLSVSISCSGLFVSRAIAKKISELDLKQIKISFDGSSEKSYDYFRGKGTYRRAIRGIKTIREMFKCKLVLHSVIMKPNIGELLSLFKAIQKLEADEWTIDFFRQIGSASSHKNFVLQPEDINLIRRTVKKFSETSEMKIKIPSLPEISSKISIYDNFGCPAGNIYCYINSIGAVKPCGFMPDSTFAGNIRNQSLQDIWINSKLFSDMRDSLGVEKCLNCGFYKSCRGGCRARCAENGKNLETNDPFCFRAVSD